MKPILRLAVMLLAVLSLAGGITAAYADSTAADTPCDMAQAYGSDSGCCVNALSGGCATGCPAGSAAICPDSGPVASASYPSPSAFQYLSRPTTRTRKPDTAPPKFSVA